MPGRAACMAALILAPAVFAEPKISDAEVIFVAHGSLGMRIEGKTADLSVSRSGDALEFVVRLETLQTGIDVRDRHMRDEVFEVQRFPLARLRVLHPPPPAATTSGTALGELTVHGQTRPVNVAFKLKARSGYDVTASFRMDLRDYGMTAPTYLGISVKPEIDVSADLHLDAP